MIEQVNLQDLSGIYHLIFAQKEHNSIR